MLGHRSYSLHSYFHVAVSHHQQRFSSLFFLVIDISLLCSPPNRLLLCIGFQSKRSYLFGHFSMYIKMVLGIQVQLALSLLSIHPLKIRSTTKKTSSSWGIEQVNLTFCKPMCSHEARVIENRGSTSGSTLPRNTTDTLFYGTQIIRLCEYSSSSSSF
ncbi:Xyloglucan endotransglucosylase/hydrolase 1 [Senna tora]|uniref:Xyloglucan endotransglucosylase/hydrolase 1 n=1 Tax=Senna tora TaxID=362788 RepID=A0A834SMX8_9FABA|nr:Xyloglucan endotransglucosylase/hydrolase 1 [Senna tora]